MIGFADKDGQGLAGAERAFDRSDPRRGRQVAGRRSPSTCASRAPCRTSCETAAAHFQVKDAVGHGGQRPHRRDPGHGQLSGLRPQRDRPRRSGHHGQPRRRHGLRAGLGVQGLHPGHGPRHRRRSTSTPCSTSARPWCCPARSSTTSTRATAACRCGRCSPTPPTSARPRWRCGSAATDEGQYFHAFGLFDRGAERAARIRPAR